MWAGLLLRAACVALLLPGAPARGYTGRKPPGHFAAERRRLGPHVCLSGFGSGCCPGWAPSMGGGHCTLRKCLSLCPKSSPPAVCVASPQSLVRGADGRPQFLVSHLHFSSQPSAPSAVGVASASLPMSAPARMESKGPPAQKPMDHVGSTAVTLPATMEAVRRWPECAPWASR
ncbi:von Willebrand factor C and EGF domains [Homo sapiens]|uniref:cDNA FLJ58937 n=1 Tax=Homo sapiens TaxID=9606 RepID=B4DS56_HUMAN|nr:von Willebrand factor C and EGF domains [Homo sapiens]BAG61518.1 unnamed protein product [Homo sapiens]